MGYPSDIYSTMPRQKLSLKKKTKKWKEQCVNTVANFGGVYNNNSGRSSTVNKQANYDVVNSILNDEDLRYVLDPYGQGDEAVNNQPSRMRDINIIVNKLNKLKGEEMSRPFNPVIAAVNGEAVSEKENKKRDLLLRVAQSKLAQELGVPQTSMVNPATGESEMPQSFESVEKYATYTMKDIREDWANHIYNYTRLHQDLEAKHNQGWEHGLIAAEEIYYIGIVNGEVSVRVANPLNCDFDRNPDDNRIENGDWFREDRWMTTGQILDEYGEFLTGAQIEKLDRGEYRPALNQNMYPEFGYRIQDIRNKEQTKFSGRMSNSHMMITHVCWKSMKRIGFVTYPDENDEMQTGIVDETFVLDPDMEAMGYSLEWKWIPEWWEGTKIGDDFFVNIRPLPNQTRSMDNPHYCPGPYVGRVYNSTNSKQTSLVDLIKPHQYLYNIVWFRLEAEIAKSRGKVFTMDVAQIPKSHGIDMEKWMYYFDNLGIALINSFEEGKGTQQGNLASSNFNQFTAMDLALSQSVQQYIVILNKIENVVDRMVGINPAREGEMHPRETAAGLNQSIDMSSDITEPYFYVHNEIKKTVASRIIEAAKFAYPSKKKLNYIVNDVERIAVTIDMEKYADSDYGVFVSNSASEHRLLNNIRMKSEQALASGAITMSDAIEIQRDTSISSIARSIKKAEDERNAREQQIAEMQQQTEQAKIQSEAAEKQAQRDHESVENQLDRENELRRDVIKTMGFDQDIQGNEINDIVQQGELFLKEVESERKHDLENKKLDSEKALKQEELDLRREEMKSKERIENKKAATALKNKVPGEK